MFVSFCFVHTYPAPARIHTKFFFLSSSRSSYFFYIYISFLSFLAELSRAGYWISGLGLQCSAQSLLSASAVFFAIIGFYSSLRLFRPWPGSAPGYANLLIKTGFHVLKNAVPDCVILIVFGCHCNVQDTGRDKQQKSMKNFYYKYYIHEEYLYNLWGTFASPN